MPARPSRTPGDEVQALFNAARIYAQAVEFAAQDVSRQGERAVTLYRRYRTRALDLLDEALQRIPDRGRREEILNDPALRPLRLGAAVEARGMRTASAPSRDLGRAGNQREVDADRAIGSSHRIRPRPTSSRHSPSLSQFSNADRPQVGRPTHEHPADTSATRRLIGDSPISARSDWPRLDGWKTGRCLSTFLVNNTADNGRARSARRSSIPTPQPARRTPSTSPSRDGVADDRPALSLPSITNPVLIDGYSQPGHGGTPLIEINGSQAGGGDGLTDHRAQR